MGKIQVAIITGSDSDLPVLSGTVAVLEKFDVKYSIAVASAHRTPKKVEEYIRLFELNGAEVIIAAAGMAAALPGVVASLTILPVIGIPMESKSLKGVDALFSIVQMPPGIPVATVAIGKAGAVNAGLLAVQMLALKDKSLNKKISKYREDIAEAVVKKNTELQKLGIAKYIKRDSKK